MNRTGWLQNRTCKHAQCGHDALSFPQAPACTSLRQFARPDTFGIRKFLCCKELVIWRCLFSSEAIGCASDARPTPVSPASVRKPYLLLENFRPDLLYCR
jgi:hypothetical protein